MPELPAMFDTVVPLTQTQVKTVGTLCVHFVMSKCTQSTLLEGSWDTDGAEGPFLGTLIGCLDSEHLLRCFSTLPLFRT